ncbi:transcriptional regulator [Mesorhizobium sp. L-8-10]|uniref:sugar-binding transcriptional regulator n=1 Tax=Mesorhizobium sp. L-8-10 TaxID=2744523 RepID=UPI0019265224|nr:sugar-binding transcriptional regulator [Mesorhizobium sp. L-8-10]BCH29126.1 transcriptional regulator [Mesorhizobium sp. L-8-10]
MSAEEAASVRLPSDEQREQLMVQAAKLFYDLEKTRTEVAAELGLTRWQVSRLLEEARASGIVRIEIVPRSKRRPDLETGLQRAFGLREAVVVPGPGSGEDDATALEFVAEAAGRYIASIQPRLPLIGVSWGRTMAAVAHWLPPKWNDGVHVVLVNGATTLRSSSQRNNMVAEAFARSGNGVASLLPVPAIVGKAGTRQVLEEDPIIARVLDLAGQAPVVCFSMGALSHENVLVGSGYIEPADIDRLAGQGAVGDLLGRFIDARGKIADPELDQRTIGLRLEALRAKERSIAIAAGKPKHALVLACLRARYMNVLVTDEATARFALENVDG